LYIRSICAAPSKFPAQNGAQINKSLPVCAASAYAGKLLEGGAKLLIRIDLLLPRENPKIRFINALPRASLTISRFTKLDLTHVRSGLCP
jgi:hypothetical protein